jgi:hypothetical protein
VAELRTFTVHQQRASTVKINMPAEYIVESADIIKAGGNVKKGKRKRRNVKFE